LLQIENATSGDLILEPNMYGRSPSYPEITTQPNEIVKILLQVRKFKTSQTHLTGPNEVVSGPYIENAGAKTGLVKLRKSYEKNHNGDFGNNGHTSYIKDRICRHSIRDNFAGEWTTTGQCANSGQWQRDKDERIWRVSS
jgi:hypothetical protein